MGATTKKPKLPVKVIARVKAALPAPKLEPKNEKKAKVVAALKRLHPMD